MIINIDEINENTLIVFNKSLKKQRYEEEGKVWFFECIICIKPRENS